MTAANRWNSGPSHLGLMSVACVIFLMLSICCCLTAVCTTDVACPLISDVKIFLSVNTDGWY